MAGADGNFEFKAFSLHRPDLIDNIADRKNCIPPLAERLNLQGLLDRFTFQSIRDDHLDNRRKAEICVHAASNCIRINPGDFYTFILVLEEVGLTHDAETLRNKLGQLLVIIYVLTEESIIFFNSDEVKEASSKSSIVL